MERKAQQFSEIMRIRDVDERIGVLESVESTDDGPGWSQATAELGWDDYGQGRWDLAKKRAQAVIDAPIHRFDEVASIRAHTLVSEVDEQLQLDYDEVRLVTTLRRARALNARLAAECGFNWEILARCHRSRSRPSDERQCLDAAARCYLETDLAAAGPGCLYRLGVIYRDAGDRERALHCVCVAIAHTKRFWPFASRNVRPRLEALQEELESPNGN